MLARNYAAALFQTIEKHIPAANGRLNDKHAIVSFMRSFPFRYRGHLIDGESIEGILLWIPIAVKCIEPMASQATRIFQPIVFKASILTSPPELYQSHMIYSLFFCR